MQSSIPEITIDKKKPFIKSEENMSKVIVVLAVFVIIIITIYILYIVVIGNVSVTY